MPGTLVIVGTCHANTENFKTEDLKLSLRYKKGAKTEAKRSKEKRNINQILVSINI